MAHGMTALPDKSGEARAVEIRVTGRVQGVGFRYFVHETARRLQLVGYVMNVRDGAVRAYAEGVTANLEAFIAAVSRGPAGASVHDVRIHRGPATGNYTTFSIRPTL